MDNKKRQVYKHLLARQPSKKEWSKENLREFKNYYRKKRQDRLASQRANSMNPEVSDIPELSDNILNNEISKS